MDKHPQAQVRYRRGFASDQCGKCTMYRKADGQYGTCTDVNGQITAYGVCDIFKGLVNPFGRLPQHERIMRANWHHHRMLSGTR